MASTGPITEPIALRHHESDTLSSKLDLLLDCFEICTMPLGKGIPIIIPKIAVSASEITSLIEKISPENISRTVESPK